MCVVVCVDNAYACDPRIAQFKLDEKERKQAGKRAKQEAIKQKAEEEERVSRFIHISIHIAQILTSQHCLYGRQYVTDG